MRTLVFWVFLRVCSNSEEQNCPFWCPIIAIFIYFLTGLIFLLIRNLISLNSVSFYRFLEKLDSFRKELNFLKQSRFLRELKASKWSLLWCSNSLLNWDCLKFSKIFIWFDKFKTFLIVFWWSFNCQRS